MKLTIERAILLKALGHVQAVVERRNTIPILSNVLINASDGFARFTATDLDMEIVEEAEASVEREGLITAPAHTLYEIARKLPEGSQVTLELGGDDPRILLSAGRSRFNLPILPPGDFPVMPSEDLAVSFTAPASEIARLIDKTKFAISTEETRYYLNGIHLHAAERDGRKTLRAVATDGHRLALAETDLPDGAMGMPAVIVPRKPIQELRRLLEDLDGDVDVSVSEGKIRINSTKISKPARTISPGDILTFPKDDHVRVIKVVAIGIRRGPAPEAQALYEDLDPPQPREKRVDQNNFPPMPKYEGKGRPTKKDRRNLPLSGASLLD